jgi:hypothetical protein
MDNYVIMEDTMDTYSTTTGGATTTGGTAIEETGRLIASDKVEGTAVYNRPDEHLESPRRAPRHGAQFYGR